MPPNETREEAAARFQAAFWEHQDERTPHNKNNPAGKKNTHKHLPTRAQLAEWVDALKDGTETQFASGQERHWAKTYLRLEGEDVFWKSSGNGGVPDMKVLCLEEWALRIFDAHVADEAVHRGRDATYEWLRDPAGGCKKPQDAPAGTVLYKAPMKEVVMTFISGCPVCKAKCSSGSSSSSSSSNSKKRKGAPSPTDDDDDNNNNNQRGASPHPQKKRATGRRVPVAPIAPAVPAVPAAAPAALDAPADLAGFANLLAGPADSADLFQWNDRGLPFRVEENLPVQGNFSYGLANAAPAPAPGLAPIGGFRLEDGLIDPALLQVGPYAEPEATESLQLGNPTLDSAPVPFVPLSDEELGIEVERAIWHDFLSFPNGRADISNFQDVNFSNEELNSSNLQDANSSNEELNFSGLQDASSSDEELDFSNLEESDYIDWDCFTA